VKKKAIESMTQISTTWDHKHPDHVPPFLCQSFRRTSTAWKVAQVGELDKSAENWLPWVTLPSADEDIRVNDTSDVYRQTRRKSRLLSVAYFAVRIFTCPLGSLFTCAAE